MRRAATSEVVTLAMPPERPFRLGVLSDTHRSSRAAAIPAAAIERMGTCDAYLHCGDFLDAAFLQPLRDRAAVYAVLGNVDPPALAFDVPAALLLVLGDWRLGAIHDAGRAPADWRRTAAAFPPPLDVLCFGHSHRPVARNAEGLLFLNPGSAVDPRDAPACSVAVLEFAAGLHVQLLRLPPSRKRSDLGARLGEGNRSDLTGGGRAGRIGG